MSSVNPAHRAVSTRRAGHRRSPRAICGGETVGVRKSTRKPRGREAGVVVFQECTENIYVMTLQIFRSKANEVSRLTIDSPVRWSLRDKYPEERLENGIATLYLSISGSVTSFYVYITTSTRLCSSRCTLTQQIS